MQYSFTVERVEPTRVDVVFHRDTYPDKRVEVPYRLPIQPAALRALIESKAPVEFWQAVDERRSGTLENLRSFVGRTFQVDTQA